MLASAPQEGLFLACHSSHETPKAPAAMAQAASWDRNVKFERLNTAVAEALRGSGLLPAPAVLELGCGTGMLAEMIADSVDVFVGVDNSPATVASFQQKIAARSDAKLHCLLGELPAALEPASTASSTAPASSGPPAVPRQYDLVVSHLTFHHIRNVPGTLSMLRQLLKPGGRIAVSDVLKEPGSDRFNNPAHLSSVFHVGGFSREEMERLLAGAGFADASFSVVASFQKPSYEDPTELLTFHLFIATATAQAT